MMMEICMSCHLKKNMIKKDRASFIINKKQIK
jgi:hypothetical protein